MSLAGVLSSTSSCIFWLFYVYKRNSILFPQVAPHSTEAAPGGVLSEGAVAPVLQDVPMPKKKHIKKEVEEKEDPLVKIVSKIKPEKCFLIVRWVCRVQDYEKNVGFPFGNLTLKVDYSEVFQASLSSSRIYHGHLRLGFYLVCWVFKRTTLDDLLGKVFYKKKHDYCWKLRRIQFRKTLVSFSFCRITHSTCELWR